MERALLVAFQGLRGLEHRELHCPQAGLHVLLSRARGGVEALKRRRRRPASSMTTSGRASWSRSTRTRSRSYSKREDAGWSARTPSSASRSVTSSSVKSCSTSRPWSMRKTATCRPAIDGRATHFLAAPTAARPVSGPSWSKTSATTAPCSTSTGSRTRARGCPVCLLVSCARRPEPEGLDLLEDAVLVDRYFLGLQVEDQSPLRVAHDEVEHHFGPGGERSSPASPGLARSAPAAEPAPARGRGTGLSGTCPDRSPLAPLEQRETDPSSPVRALVGPGGYLRRVLSIPAGAALLHRRGAAPPTSRGTVASSWPSASGPDSSAPTSPDFSAGQFALAVSARLERGLFAEDAHACPALPALAPAPRRPCPASP